MAIPTLPMYASPEGFNLLKHQLPILDSADALLNGVIAISMMKIPVTNVEQIDQQLQRYVDRVRSRVRGRQKQALLAHLHNILFEEEGFRGNEEDYYNVQNSYLPCVLSSKRGLPITLSLIYKIVAERLGLKAYGVALPGYFLVGLEIDDQRMLVDTFRCGRILTEREAHVKLQELFDPEVEWSEELLKPVSNRHWLTRILQNMLNVFGSSGHYNDVASVLEMEMLLWPEQIHLQRDMGLTLARCGISDVAKIWLRSYLDSDPDDPQKSQLEEMLHILES